MAEKNNIEKIAATKERVRQWREEHWDEYKTFINAMEKMPGDQLALFFQTMSFKMGGMKFSKAWERKWEDDAPVNNLEDMFLVFKESHLPESLVKAFNSQVNEEPVGTKKEDDPTSLWGIVKSLFKSDPKPQVKISVPLILSWLMFGQAFETILDVVSNLSKDPNVNIAQRKLMGKMAKTVIKVSIENGFRTQEDWNEHFAIKKAAANGNTDEWAMQSINDEIAHEQQAKEEATELAKTKEQLAAIEQEKQAAIADAQAKDMQLQQVTIQKEKAEFEKARLELTIAKEQDKTPKVPGRQKSKDMLLIDYLNCENKDAVIAVIRKFANANNTGDKLALPYYALSNLNLFVTVPNATEYSTAFAKQFADIDGLKGESSYRQSVGKLNKPAYVIINEKNVQATPLESDNLAPVLAKLTKDIEAAL